MDARVKLASPANIISVLSKPESHAFTSNQLSRGLPILHYPKPDFSKIKPKTNSWNTPKFGGRIKEVSFAATCRMVQMKGNQMPGFNF
jgi:hypothetical protein